MGNIPTGGRAGAPSLSLRTSPPSTTSNRRRSSSSSSSGTTPSLPSRGPRAPTTSTGVGTTATSTGATIHLAGGGGGGGGERAHASASVGVSTATMATSSSGSTLPTTARPSRSHRVCSSGSSVNHIPCPFLANSAQWGEVTRSTRFCEFMLTNLSNDTLVDAVLDGGGDALAIVEEGLESYSGEVERQRLAELCGNWDLMAGSGVVEAGSSNARTITALLAELRSVRAKPPPFIVSLKKRQAVVKCLHSTTINERTFSTRVYRKCALVAPRRTAGESGAVRLAVTMNGVCLQALNALASLVMASLPGVRGEEEEETTASAAPFDFAFGTEAAIAAVVGGPLCALSEMLQSFPALALYKEWSPAPAPPETAVAIDALSARATSTAQSMPAANAVLEGTRLCWRSNSRPSGPVHWEIKLESPREVSSVRVQWSGGRGLSSRVSAPQKIALELSSDGGKTFRAVYRDDLEHRVVGSDGDVGSGAGGSDGNDDERPSGGEGWNHWYPADNSLATHVRLVMTGINFRNTSGCLELYDVAVNARATAPEASPPSSFPSSSSSFVDTFRLITDLQRFLVRVARIPSSRGSGEQDGLARLQTEAVRALLAICTASGALMAFICAINIIHMLECERSAAGDGPSPPAVAWSEAGERTLESISACEAQVSRSQRRTDVRVHSDAVFDDSNLHSSIELREGGKVASSSAGSTPNGAALVTVGCARGTWVWEMTIVEDTAGDETTCMGVAVKPVSEGGYESSTSLWMVRCYNGQTYFQGRKQDLTICNIHPHDLVRLTLDCAAHTLSVAVNGVDQGVIFSGLPVDTFYPAVCFYGSSKAVRLVSVRQEGCEIAVAVDNSCDGDSDCKEGRSGAGESAIATDGDGDERKAQDGDAAENKSSPAKSGAVFSCFRSRGSPLSARLLCRLARLARMYTRADEKRAEGLDAAISNGDERFGSRASLEDPMCIQPCAEVFAQLHSMLASRLEERRPHDDTSVRDQALCAVMSLIEANFSKLVIMHVDPVNVGLHLGGASFSSQGGDVHSISALDGLQGTLQKIYSGSYSAELRRAAVRAIGAGLVLLVPELLSRLQLLLALLRECHENGTGDGEDRHAPATVDPSGDDVCPRHLLLLLVLKTFSVPANVVEMLPPATGNNDVGDTASRTKTRWRRREWTRCEPCVLAVLAALMKVVNSGSGDRNPGQSTASTTTSVPQLAVTILRTYQRHLLSLTAEQMSQQERGRGGGVTGVHSCADRMLVKYTCLVTQHCCDAMKLACTTDDDSRGDEPPHALRQSLVGTILPPFLTGLTLFGDCLRLAKGLITPIVQVAAALGVLQQSSARVKQAEHLLLSMSTAMPRRNFAGAVAGWREVPAKFENFDSSFSVKDGGNLFVSQNGNNTAAPVDIVFTQGRAAWEFRLEVDSLNDECSCFGACLRPLDSRCYTSSPQLLMRRSYNGYMYQLGRQCRPPYMDKIHPGDVVRCELDFEAGTMTFAVNGVPSDGGFEGVTGEISPCIATYRANIQVRLLKVEVYGSTPLGYPSSSCSGEDGGSINTAPAPFGVCAEVPTSLTFYRAPGFTHSALSVKRNAVGIDASANRRLATESVATHSEPLKCFTVRTVQGFGGGCHTWGVALDKCDKPRQAGAVGIALISHNEGVDFNATPLDVEASAAVTACKAPLGSASKSPKSWSWRLDDGSLWCCGKCVSAEGEPFGASALPLSRGAVVTFVADLFSRTLAISVDGTELGIAFGPDGSGAFASGMCWPSLTQGQKLHPAVSVMSENTTMLIEPAGLNGATLLLPWTLDLQQTASVLGGFLASTLIAGSAFDEEEKHMEPWMQSILCIGGPSASSVGQEEPDSRSGGALSVASAPSGDLQGEIDTITHELPSVDCALQRRVALQPSTCLSRTAACPIQSVLIRACAAEGLRNVQLFGSQDPYLKIILLDKNDASGGVGEELAATVTAAAAGGGTEPTWDRQIAHELHVPTTERRATLLGEAILRVLVLNESFVSRLFAETTATDEEIARVDIPLAALRSAGKGKVDEAQVERKFELDTGGHVLLCVDVVVSERSTAPGPDPLAKSPKTVHRDPSPFKAEPKTARAQAVGGPGRLEEWNSFLREIVTASVGPATDAAHFAVAKNSGANGQLSTAPSKLACLLLSWLETIDPEPAMMRRVMEMKGSYSFPKCELPFLAAMLKHAGLVKEAYAAVQCLSDEAEATNSTVNVKCEPSPNMRKLWLKIRALRRYLRQQRQLFRTQMADASVAATAAATKKHAAASKREHASRADSKRKKPPRRATSRGWRLLRLDDHMTSVVEDALAARGDDDDVGVGDSDDDENDDDDDDDDDDDEKQDSKVELEQKEHKDGNPDDDGGGGEDAPASAADAKDSDTASPAAALPGTFDDLCVAIAQRGHFLLGMSSVLLRESAGDSEKEGGDVHAPVHQSTSSVQLSELDQLAESYQPLQPMLRRWKSIGKPDSGGGALDGGEERWRGVVQVLRVQEQLQRQKSSNTGSTVVDDAAFTGVAGSGTPSTTSQAPIVEEAGDDDVGTAADNINAGPGGRRLLNSSSWLSLDTDGGDSGGGSDADSSPEGAAIHACALYVQSGGSGAPPKRLNDLIDKRENRAAERIFGFESLLALLHAVEQSPSSLENALLFLRPALCGVHIRMSDDSNSLLSAEPAVVIRPGAGSGKTRNKHHYLKTLEGCSVVTMSEVQAAFQALYSKLALLLGRSWNEQWSGLGHVLATAWALDLEPRDLDFLATCGLLPVLQAMLSLSSTATAARRRLALPILPLSTTGSSFESPAHHPSTVWAPWSIDFVRNGFIHGFLTMRVVAAHLLAAPESFMPSSWARERRSVQSVVEQHTPSSLLAICEEVVRTVEEQKVAARERAARREVRAKRRRERTEAKAVAAAIKARIPLLDDMRKSDTVELSGARMVATFTRSSPVGAVFGWEVVFDCEADSASDTGNYFELTVLNSGRSGSIGIGLADDNTFPLTGQMPGWVSGSYGYHGDDGRKFGQNATMGTWPLWVEGDVIGCGFDFAERNIFFTRNGEFLGAGFAGISETRLVPVIGFHSLGESARVNFGLEPFAYDGEEVVVAARVLGARADIARKAEGKRDRKLRQQRGAIRLETAIAAERSSAAEATGGEKRGGKLTLGVKHAAHQFGNGGLDEEKEEWSPVQQTSRVLRLDESEANLACLQASGWALFRLLATISAASPGNSPAGRRNGDNDSISSQTFSTPLSDVVENPPGAAAKPPTSGIPDAPPPLLKKEHSMFGTRRSETFESSRRFHQDVFDIVARELRLASLILSRSPNDGLTHNGDPKKNHRRGGTAAAAVPSSNVVAELDGLEKSEIEFHAYHMLLYLCAMRRSKIVRQHLSTKAFLKSVLMLMKHGSPRIRRLSLYILRAVLPSLTSEYLQDIVVSVCGGGGAAADDSFSSLSWKLATGGAGPKRASLVDVIMQIIGGAMIAQDVGHCAVDGSGVSETTDASRGASGLSANLGDSGYGSGHVMLALAEDCCELLRSLLKAPSWREAVARSLASALRQAHKLVASKALADLCSRSQQIAPAVSAVRNALAALSVLGGIKCIRTGGLARLPSGTLYTVVQYHRGQEHAMVVPNGKLKSTTIVPESVAVTELMPVTHRLGHSPDTPSQPVMDQLLVLVRELLESETRNGAKGGDENDTKSGAATEGSGGRDSRSTRNSPAPHWQGRLKMQALRALNVIISECADLGSLLCADRLSEVVPLILGVALEPVSSRTSFASMQHVETKAAVIHERQLETEAMPAVIGRVQRRALLIPLPSDEGKLLDGEGSVDALQRQIDTASGCRALSLADRCEATVNGHAGEAGSEAGTNDSDSTESSISLDMLLARLEENAEVLNVVPSAAASALPMPHEARWARDLARIQSRAIEAPDMLGDDDSAASLTQEQVLMSAMSVRLEGSRPPTRRGRLSSPLGRAARSRRCLASSASPVPSKEPTRSDPHFSATTPRCCGSRFALSTPDSVGARKSNAHRVLEIYTASFMSISDRTEALPFPFAEIGSGEAAHRICVAALEMNGDIPELAVEWLLTHGSLLGDRARGHHSLVNASSKYDSIDAGVREGPEWAPTDISPLLCIGDVAAVPLVSLVAASSAEGEDETKLEDDSMHATFASASGTAFVDLSMCEVELAPVQCIPAQLEDLEGQDPSVSFDVVPEGALLTVTGSEGPAAMLHGETGRLRRGSSGVAREGKTVALDIFDPETGQCLLQPVQWSDVKYTQGDLYGHRVRSMDDLLRLGTANDAVLATRFARSAVVNLLNSGAVLHALRGVGRFLQLLRLVASNEFIDARSGMHGARFAASALSTGENAFPTRSGDSAPPLEAGPPILTTLCDHMFEVLQEESGLRGETSGETALPGSLSHAVLHELLWTFNTLARSTTSGSVGAEATPSARFADSFSSDEVGANESVVSDAGEADTTEIGNKRSGVVVLESLHPFFAPHEPFAYEGEVKVASDGGGGGDAVVDDESPNSPLLSGPRGIRVTVDNRSATVSASAMLSIYKTEADLRQKAHPVHRMFGPTGFKSFVLTETDHFFYRFETLPGAHKPPLRWAWRHGHLHRETSSVLQVRGRMIPPLVTVTKQNVASGGKGARRLPGGNIRGSPLVLPENHWMEEEEEACSLLVNMFTEDDRVEEEEDTSGYHSPPASRREVISSLLQRRSARLLEVSENDRATATMNHGRDGRPADIGALKDDGNSGSLIGMDAVHWQSLTNVRICRDVVHKNPPDDTSHHCVEREFQSSMSTTPDWAVSARNTLEDRGDVSATAHGRHKGKRKSRKGRRPSRTQAEHCDAPTHDALSLSLTSGRWYYEVKVAKPGWARIGWTAKPFDAVDDAVARRRTDARRGGIAIGNDAAGDYAEFGDRNPTVLQGASEGATGYSWAIGCNGKPSRGNTSEAQTATARKDVLSMETADELDRTVSPEPRLASAAEEADLPPDTEPLLRTGSSSDAPPPTLTLMRTATEDIVGDAFGSDSNANSNDSFDWSLPQQPSLPLPEPFSRAGACMAEAKDADIFDKRSNSERYSSASQAIASQDDDVNADFQTGEAWYSPENCTGNGGDSSAAGRTCLWHGGKPRALGRAWRVGDTVCCAADLDLGVLHWCLNGEWDRAENSGDGDMLNYRARRPNSPHSLFGSDSMGTASLDAPDGAGLVDCGGGKFGLVHDSTNGACDSVSATVMIDSWRVSTGGAVDDGDDVFGEEKGGCGFGGLSPAFSLDQTASLRPNFGDFPFEHEPPPWWERGSFSPIVDRPLDQQSSQQKMADDTPHCCNGFAKAHGEEKEDADLSFSSESDTPSSTAACEEAVDDDDDGEGLIYYRLIRQGGALVRREAGMSSAEVGTIPYGTLVTVDRRVWFHERNPDPLRRHRDGFYRVHIISPPEWCGWASDKSHILERDFSARLTDHNALLLGESQRKRSLSAQVWGFRFLAEPIEGVRAHTVREFSLVWRGTNKSTRMPCSIWRPRLPGPGWHSLGDVAMAGLLPPGGATVVFDEGNGLLAEPVSLTMVWNADKEKLVGNTVPTTAAPVFWRSRAPPGYVALGDVTSVQTAKGSSPGTNPVAPSISTLSIRCVRSWAVRPIVRRDAGDFGVDNGSDLSGLPSSHLLWSGDSGAIWGAHDVDCGTFFATNGLGRSAVRNSPRNICLLQAKADPYFVIDGDKDGSHWQMTAGPVAYALRCTRTTSARSDWSCEAHTRREPCLTWAIWLLNMLLDVPVVPNDHDATRSVSPVNAASRNAPVLYSPIVHRPELFAAITSFLRSRHSPRRLSVVPLLTRMVQSHWLFATSEPGPAPMSPSSAGPPLHLLEGVAREVIRACTRITRDGGGAKDKDKDKKKAGSHEAQKRFLPSNLLQLMELVIAVRCAERERKRGVRSSPVAADHPRTLEAEGVDRKVDLRLPSPSSIRSEEAALSDVMDLLDFLRTGDTGSLQDELVCSIWEASFGRVTSRESSHPYIRNPEAESLAAVGVPEGESVDSEAITFEGATKLHVVLDARCSTAPGTVLKFVCGSQTATVGGGCDETLWQPSEFSFVGDTLTYSFVTDEAAARDVPSKKRLSLRSDEKESRSVDRSSSTPASGEMRTREPVGQTSRMRGQLLDMVEDNTLDFLRQRVLEMSGEEVSTLSGQLEGAVFEESPFDDGSEVEFLMTSSTGSLPIPPPGSLLPPPPPPVRMLSPPGPSPPPVPALATKRNDDGHDDSIDASAEDKMWGFGFTVVAEGPVGETTTRASEHPYPPSASGCDAVTFASSVVVEEEELHFAGAESLEITFNKKCATGFGDRLYFEAMPADDDAAEEAASSTSVVAAVPTDHKEVAGAGAANNGDADREHAAAGAPKRAWEVEEKPPAPLQQATHVRGGGGAEWDSITLLGDRLRYRVVVAQNPAGCENAAEEPPLVGGRVAPALPAAVTAAASPSPSPDGEKRKLHIPRICANCGKYGLLKCGQCKSVRFCSKPCQVEHWQNGHESECIPIDGAAGTDKSPAHDNKRPWGWEFTVRANGLTRNAVLRRMVELQGATAAGPLALRRASWEPGSSAAGGLGLGGDWSVDMDKSLAAAINEVVESAESKEPEAAATAHCVRLSRRQARFQHQCLGGISLANIRVRSAVLCLLNQRLRHVMPLIDTSNPCAESLGGQLRQLGYCVLFHHKESTLQAAVEATKGSGGDSTSIVLDNFVATASRENNEVEPGVSRCCFAQAFQQLHTHDPAVLRTVWSGDRVFQVKFNGESGIDAGGVFREGVSRIVEDLFSAHFHLLLLCPNGQHSMHLNMDKYLPHPGHTGPLATRMFEFLGKMIGVSVRARLCLPFEFPSIVWKQLCGQELEEDDLLAVDTITCQFLKALRECERDGITDAELFDEKYGSLEGVGAGGGAGAEIVDGGLRFTCSGSDGVECELVPDGASRRVTYNNREEYCGLVVHHRLHEFDAQVAAMRRGLATIVPMRAIQFFTWQELDVLVCGSPQFDIDFWRGRTDYQGYTEEDVTIRLFWEVMSSLTPQEQSGWVRFAWGRSRLPPKNAWYNNMKLTRRNVSGPLSEQLPVSHTCFFSVELPPYTTEASMRRGLLTAIHFGVGGILNG